MRGSLQTYSPLMASSLAARLDRVILFVVAFLFLAVGSFWGLPSGKAVAGALVILDGGVPYRDFWTMYAPGQFYAVAALFGLFGRELFVQAIAVCLVRAAAAVSFHLLLCRLGASRWSALGLSIVFVLMFWRTAPELTDYAPALLCLLLALNLIVAYFETGGRGHLRWAGVWLGVAACFKHDVAAYIAVGVTVSLFASWWLVKQRRPATWLPPARATLVVATAALATIAPLSIVTAWTAASDAWNDLFVFPFAVFPKVRGDLFPAVIPDLSLVFEWLSQPRRAAAALAAAQGLAPWAVLRGPEVVFLGGVAVLLATFRRAAPARIGQLLMLLGGMPFFWTAAHVQHNTHPYTLAVLGAGIGVIAWSLFGDRIDSRRWLRVPLSMFIAVYVGGLVTAAGIEAALVYYEWQGSRVLQLSGFRGVRVPARVYDSVEPIGRFVRTHTNAGEPIYTGLLRHDSIVVNNALLYAIADRPACCGYTELHPGVGDRAAVHREIIRKLETTGVGTIVLWEFGWPERVMEARKRHTMAAVADAGSTLLDDYIAQRFERVEQHGELHVFRRRPAPVPAKPVAEHTVPNAR